MPLYIVRVELNGARGQSDYERLHAAMANAGFFRTLQLGGVTYQLPTAEYAINSNLSTTQLRDNVRKIASLVDAANLILIIRSEDISVYLKPVS